MLFLILATFISSSGALFLPSNLRASTSPKTLACCRIKNEDVFDPFAGSTFLKIESPSSHITHDESDNGHQISKLFPALSMLAFFAMISAADATVDAIAVPLQGIQLYGR